jgi:succinyl-CoA synthetase beta subunit
VKLLEYEAKAILSNYNIAVPASTVIKSSSPPNLTIPIVLKSQVPVGGRGKAGGIKIIDNIADVRDTITSLFNIEIKGFKPNAILAEEKLNIKNEYYLSLLIDRASSSIRLIANLNGGVEVESNPVDSYLNIEIQAESVEADGQQLADYLHLPGQTFVLQDLIEKLYKCFVASDALLLEINPLVFTTDQKLVAGDCKITLDNNAAFRHEWAYEEKPTEANFVTLDPAGNIATIANGAGLAMATVDAAADYGMKPANFLDIGGGANTASLLASFKRITSFSNVQAIVINVFAGITRCDEVARAIIEARKQMSDLPPLFICLAGTNFEAAAKLLASEAIPLMSTLEDCLKAAHSEVTS